MRNNSGSRIGLFAAMIATISICLIILFTYLFSNYSSRPPFIIKTTPEVSVTHATLPPFPWPVPKPSAFEVLPLESLGWPDGTGVTFQDVDQRISNALESAGYGEKSYFRVPSGFAIVTRLEKIDTDGYPDYSNRWASSLAPISLEDFSLPKYLEALIGVPKGRYRVFVFVISPESIIQSGTPVAQEDAQTWIVEGANKLPNQMKDLQYTREYTTTAYIYEFIQSGVGEAASYNIPSDFTGRQHLERSGLWKTLYPSTTIIKDEFDYDTGWRYFITHGNGSGERAEFTRDSMTFFLNGRDIDAYYLYENFKYKDVRLDVQAVNRGEIDAEIGLICRYTKDGWYEFSIASTGEWELFAAMPISDGQAIYKNVIDRGNALMLMEGDYANKFSMICKGNEIQLLVNDRAIKTAHENRFVFDEGYVGVNTSSLADYPVIVEVDSIMISEP